MRRVKSTGDSLFLLRKAVISKALSAFYNMLCFNVNRNHFLLFRFMCEERYNKLLKYDYLLCRAFENFGNYLLNIQKLSSVSLLQKSLNLLRDYRISCQFQSR